MDPRQNTPNPYQPQPPRQPYAPQPGPGVPLPQQQYPQQQPPVPGMPPGASYQRNNNPYTQQAPVSPDYALAGPSKRKMRLKALGVWVALIAAGAGAYFAVNFISLGGPGEPLGIRTAGNFSFEAPKNLEGYREQDTGTDEITTYTSDDDLCELSFGVTSDEQLPGSSPQNIANAQADIIRNEDITVDGPTAGANLTLSQTGRGSKRYNLPTYSFSYMGDTSVVTRYSAAILPNDQRGFVKRSCEAKSSTQKRPSDASLNGVEAAAKHIKIKPGDE